MVITPTMELQQCAIHLSKCRSTLVSILEIDWALTCNKTSFSITSLQIENLRQRWDYAKTCGTICTMELNTESKLASHDAMTYQMIPR